MGSYTLLIEKPNFHTDEVWEYIEETMRGNGFSLCCKLKGRLSQAQARGLYEGLRREKKPYKTIPPQFIVNGVVIVSVWYHLKDAVSLAKELVGPTYAAESMKLDCMRGHLLRKYGQAQPPFENAANFIHVPSNEAEYKEQLQAIFGPHPKWS